MPLDTFLKDLLMYKIFKSLILTIIPAILIISCNNGTATNNNIPITSSYLVKPTGPYGVGFKDYHYINTNICPDANYIPNTNESYFSPGNQGGLGTNFCHEIMVRIYYPSDISSSKEQGKLYYPVMTQQLQEQLAQTDPSLTSDQLETLNTIFSYRTESIPIANSQFPVILFNPGYGLPSQLYENLITQLVSNGYIVIGINSVLVSGNIQLPNGVITLVVYPSSESEALADYNEALSDLKFIYNEVINTSSNMSDPIFTKFNLSQIGALAHSIWVRWPLQMELSKILHGLKQ